jgi:hypothetical protein
MICFEELVNYYLLEKISKAQQEAGQREMEKENIKPFVQLKKYLFNKWENKKLNKEQRIQKRMEYWRFNYLIELSKEFLAESDPKSQHYLKNITGSYLDWLAGPSDLVLGDKEESGIVRGNDEKVPAFMSVGRPSLKNKEEIGGGFKFKIDGKKIRKCIRKLIVLHEYGHLYEFLKEVIETGESDIVDTLHDSTDKVVDSEGKANAYALDNMYRKDRRELLKNSGLKKTDLDNSEKAIKGEHYISDEYLAGTKRHSKTLEKTLKGIEKEKSHFNY